MRNNSVFRKNVSTRDWFVGTGARCIATFVETFAGFFVVGAGLGDIQWKTAFSVSATATIFCFVKCLKGIPEVKAIEEEEIINE